MTPTELIEHDERWFKRYLLIAFLLGLIAVAVTIVWVRPGNVSADDTIVDAVKALGAAAVAIFLAAALTVPISGSVNRSGAGSRG